MNARSVAAVLWTVFFSASFGTATAEESYRSPYPLMMTPSDAWMAGVAETGRRQGRYVEAWFRRIRHDPAPPVLLGQHLYAFDCSSPVSVALLAFGLNLEDGLQKGRFVPEGTPLQQIKYEPLETFIINRDRAMRQGAQSDQAVADEVKARKGRPDELRLLAQFACEATKPGAQPRQVAERLRETGGATDAKTLICEVKEAGKGSHAVSVIFSEKNDWVQWQGRWQLNRAITANRIECSSENTDPQVKVQIDRRTGEIVITVANTEFAKGTCQAAIDMPRKF